jgi:hypothetical protein
LLALGAACDAGSPDARGPAGAEPAGGAGAPPASRRPESEPVRPLPALPAPGEAAVTVVGGRVTLSSNAAPLLDVLERLAEAAQFELRAGGLAGRLSTARIDDLPLSEALPRLLGDIPYQTEYAFDLESRAHYLARLRVGEEAVSETPAAEARELAPPSDAADAGRREAPRPGERPDAARESRDIEREQAELLAQLESPDAELRAEAAWNLEPEGEGLTRLIEVLASDPDPRVRVAATGSLENAETFAAVRALVDALDDPDPEVVLEVIDSLEFAGDESNVDDLAPLLLHPDPRVRETAAEAIEFLGD